MNQSQDEYKKAFEASQNLQDKLRITQEYTETLIAEKDNAFKITEAMSNQALQYKDQIEQMTKDAEKYAEEDEKYKNTIQAKNELEGYCFSVKSIYTDDKMKEKLGEEEVKKLEEK